MARKFPSNKQNQNLKIPNREAKLSRLNESLDPEALEILKDIPDDDRRKKLLTLLSIKSHTSIFSSPIPPPEILKGYNEIIPDGADRILKMVERQSEHRISLENNVIIRQQKQSGAGQIMGFVLSLVLIGASVFLGINGHDVLAATLGGATIVALASVFVIGQNKQQKDLNDKN